MASWLVCSLFRIELRQGTLLSQLRAKWQMGTGEVSPVIN